MKKLLSLLAALLLILFVFACSEEENPVNPNNPTVSGSWKGKATYMDFTIFQMDAALTQSGTSVSGTSYWINRSDTSSEFTVSGNNNYPSVNLTYTAPGQGGTYIFTGSFVNNDSLKGTLKSELSGVSYSMGMKRQ